MSRFHGDPSSSSLAGGSWKAMVCGMFRHLRPKGLGTSTLQRPGGRFWDVPMYVGKKFYKN